MDALQMLTKPQCFRLNVSFAVILLGQANESYIQ